jgi:predicted AlkP superfamily pyrophosphatase or phosphodiesterase
MSRTSMLVLGLLLLAPLMFLQSTKRQAPPVAPPPVLAVRVPDHAPKLLVLVVFDQMRGDYLARWSSLYGNDGFNKLIREGASFTNCHYPYSMTVTGAGHATLGTGCVPAQHGIVENDWYDRSIPAGVYCATYGDRYGMVPRGAKSKSGAAAGGAPVRLLVPALGDYVKAATSNRGKVIGISLKDRGGVLPTGTKADFCFWYDNNAGAFVSSTYYADSLPRYMTEFNKSRFADQWFNKPWTRFRTDINYATYSSEDDASGEGNGEKQGRTFPHPMTGGVKKPGTKFYDAVYTSPFGNDLTWAAAKVVIENEKLGQDANTDYLVVSYSSNDSVGHAYGPDSQEVLDISLRSDMIVAEMIAHLDAKVGRQNYVLALSSDHGICPNPEIARAAGHQAARIDPKLEVVELEFTLKVKYKTTVKWIEAIHGAGVYLNRQAIRQSGLTPQQAEDVVAQWFLSRPYAQEVYTRSQIMSDSTLPVMGQMVRNCFHPDRSGDVMPILKPYHFISKYTTGTTHGSPNEYDTHVPLVFFGGNVVPGKHTEKVSPQLAAVVLGQAIGQTLRDSQVKAPGGLLK